MAFLCPEGLSIARFDKALHDRRAFDCGEKELNDYIQKQARQDQERDICITHVLIREGSTSIIGYISIAGATITRGLLPPEQAKKLGKHPVIPGALIARLAVHRDFQGKRCGELLLLFALSTLRDQSETSGLALVLVDAKHEKAAGFYRRYGFFELHTPQVRSPIDAVLLALRLRARPPAIYPLRMAISMATIRGIALPKSDAAGT